MENYSKLIPDVEEDVWLRERTHTKTGGKVPYIFYPRNLDELKKVVTTLKSDNVYFEVLGEMTNIAVSEDDLDFVIVNMMRYENEAEPVWDGNRFLTVSASMKMKQLAIWAFNSNIKGLAWMEGIPGTVGAGIFMNAGFLVGQDMETYLVSAEYLDLDDLQVKTVQNQGLDFRYRYSKFHDMNAIVLQGTFMVYPLKRDWKLPLRKYKLKTQMNEYHVRRAKNQPLELPSAGTVFVPPMPWHVGGMMRELNLVGHQIGGAQISPKSPGFIVNVGGMTGEDYFDLVDFMQNKVYENYNLRIVPEVRLIKRNGDPRRQH
ncbi:UDP-N-acetylmuramate dehydrogenase [Weissella cibaria]|uniref:UDP-N-acetylmuramate dehydrogenase n=1 Tax=Weissella cibaria TaxID=137591 RepID=UPI00106EB817|nr:UDP-N-acetylmuramate dehydrogenase [Weissella cibaria]